MIDSTAPPEFETVTVVGNSMDRAGLLDGMQVRMRLTDYARTGNVVAARLVDGSETIKRLRRSRGPNGDVWSWLVPISSDPQHEARRMGEGDRIMGVLDMEGLKPWEALIDPPHVYEGWEFWQTVPPAPEPEQPPPAWEYPPEPPPRLRVLTRFPRRAPSPQRTELRYAGVVGDHVPIDTRAERRMLVSQLAAEGADFCVVQGGENLRGLGIESGDLLYVASAFGKARRGYHRRQFDMGSVVIVEHEGMAFAGELQRYAGQLRVFSRTGMAPHLEASVAIALDEILGSVILAEGAAPDEVLAGS